MNHTSLKILIVDDDEGDRKHVLRALKQSGLSVEAIEVLGIDQALGACQEQTFNCALVDYHMPGQDGLSIVTTFHEQFPYMATIMVTAQGDEMVASQVIKAGAGDYLPKNQVTPSALKKTIEHVVERTEYQKKLDQQRDELLRFSRVLVHDLKAPLQLIQELAKVVNENMSNQDLNEEVTQSTDGIYKVAKTMEALIHSLAEYTKFDATVEYAEVSLNESIAVAASLLEVPIREKGAEIIFKDLPSIYGHEPQIIQLFQNLLSNALKYNESKRPTITISWEKKSDGYRILVQDNGIGIPEKHYREIFKPFVRLHGKDSSYYGSGLGLATCQKIIERHGGTLACQSVKGQGTTFSITFPFKEEIG